jgi:predicted nucleic acid-binding protein
MIFLVDANILLRLVQILSIHYAEAKNAVDKLLKRGDTLFITLAKCFRILERLHSSC